VQEPADGCPLNEAAAPHGPGRRAGVVHGRALPSSSKVVSGLDFLSGQTKNPPLLRAFVRSEIAPISAVNTRTGVCIDAPPRGRHAPTREHFEVDTGSGFRFRLDRLRAMKRHWQAALNRTFGSAPIQAVADPIGAARQQA